MSSRGESALAVVRSIALAGYLAMAIGGNPASGQTTDELSEALRDAVLAGDLASAEVLIAEGAPPSEGLIAAARTNNVDLLGFLADRGGRFDDFYGSRALAVALLAESRDAIRVLQAGGANLEARDPSGSTVLVWASGERRLGPLVEVVIREGADLDAASRTGETALMTATRHGRLSSVRKLLRAGASVDLEDKDGWTALMFAVRVRNAKMVHALLAAGALTDRESDLGWTPLMLAAREGSPVIVEKLLRAGARPDRRSQFQPAPLVHAMLGRHRAVARRLLRGGADPGVGEQGDPLWWARALGRRNILKQIGRASGEAR